MVKKQSDRVSKPVSEPTKKTCKNPGEIDPNNIVSAPRNRKNIDYKAIENAKVVEVKRNTVNTAEKRAEIKPPSKKVSKRSEKIGVGESMFKPTKKTVEGSSYHGNTVSCTAGDLLKLFPNCRVHVCHDSQYEFYMENSNGDVITVYDHGLDKYGVKLGLDESWVFNIGGFSKDVTKQAQTDIENLLKQLKKK